MKYLLLLLFSVFFGVAEARLSDGKATLHVQGTQLRGMIAEGFHFNKEAPASLAIEQEEAAPLKKEEKELIFDLSKASGKNLQVSFYVCDDKKTVCEEHKYNYKFLAGKLQSATKPATVSKNVVKSGTDKKIHRNTYGFIENNLEAALSQAKKENKLVLVDYGAPWCPACVRLETEVFGTSVFKKATRKFVKLALNADMAANKPFGETYKIKALPTLLILNSQGNEVYRSLDFKPAGALSRELSGISKKNSLIAAIEKKAEAGDVAAQEKMAEHSFNKMDFEAAVHWYEKLKSPNSFYAYSEISLWADKNEADIKNRDGYIQVLKKWIALDPNSYTAASARNDWASLYQQEKKDVPGELKAELQKNLELLSSVGISSEKSKDFLAQWKVSDMAPFEQEEVLSQWLSSAKALKKDDLAAQINMQLKGLLAKKDFSVDRPGEIMAGQTYLRKAEMKDEEETWLVRLTQKYPESYVYHMRLARFYMKHKSFSKALPEAEKAVEFGEELRLSNLQSLAQIQKELNLKEDAKKSIERALALPEAQLEKYKSVAQALEELKKSL